MVSRRITHSCRLRHALDASTWPGPIRQSGLLHRCRAQHPLECLDTELQRPREAVRYHHHVAAIDRAEPEPPCPRPETA